jgi:hypothetical protein
MPRMILVLSLAAGLAVAARPGMAETPAGPNGPETRLPNFYVSPTDEYEPPNAGDPPRLAPPQQLPDPPRMEERFRAEERRPPAEPPRTTERPQAGERPHATERPRPQARKRRAPHAGADDTSLSGIFSHGRYRTPDSLGAAAPRSGGPADPDALLYRYAPAPDRPPGRTVSPCPGASRTSLAALFACPR